MEKKFAVEAPPDIEWFDAGLVDGPNYDEIDNPAMLKLDTEDSIITEFVQHPVPLEPPQDKHVPPPKPMYLTSKEQAKLRRQRRMADLKEEQAKVRSAPETVNKITPGFTITDSSPDTFGSGPCATTQN